MFCCAYSSAMVLAASAANCGLLCVVDDPDQAGRVFRHDEHSAEERADQSGFLRRFVGGRRGNRGRGAGFEIRLRAQVLAAARA